MTLRPPDDEQFAFAHWATDGNRDVRKTAADLQIPERTAYYWHKTYDWQGRYRDQVQEVAADAVEIAKDELRLGLSAATRRLISIIDDQSAPLSYVLDSIRLLFAVTMSPDDYVANTNLTLLQARQVVDNASLKMGKSDLKAAASRVLEENVASSRVHRGKRKL